MTACNKVTCTSKMTHNHGTFCDKNCEACYGKVVVLNLPDTRTEKEH